jgi:glutamate 5-kinase
MLNVIKIGSGCLFDEKGELSTSLLEQKAREIEVSRDDAILVVSGSIAIGKRIEKDYRGNEEIPSVELQGYATDGQMELMKIYQNVFSRRVAQLLVTREDLVHENHVRELLDLNLKKRRITAINYNDGIDFEELRKDNDTLAATILQHVGADRLIILGRGYDGLQGKDGKVIVRVSSITPDIEELCNGKSQHGNGGFETKLEAAKMVLEARKEMIVGNITYPLADLVSGAAVRTLFKGVY